MRLRARNPLGVETMSPLNLSATLTGSISSSEMRSPRTICRYSASDREALSSPMCPPQTRLETSCRFESRLALCAQENTLDDLIDDARHLAWVPALLRPFRDFLAGLLREI